MYRKSLSLLLALILLMLSSCTDHRVKTKFFTQGSCEECGPYIEKILLDHPGVKEASWDYQTSLTEVVFDSTKANENSMQEALAGGGFSTTFFEGDTTSWKELPTCCTKVIERKLLPNSGGHGH